MQQRRGGEEVARTFIAACMLIVGTYGPAVSVREQFQHAPAQAQAAAPQSQAQTERDQQGTPRPDIRRGHTSVAQESAVARRRAESRRPLGGPATDAQPPQPGTQQLPAAMGLLLALALLNGSAPPAISQPEIKPWMRVTGDVKARDSDGDSRR